MAAVIDTGVARDLLPAGFGSTAERIARGMRVHRGAARAGHDHPSPGARRRADLAGVNLVAAPDREPRRRSAGCFGAGAPTGASGGPETDRDPNRTQETPT